MNVPIRGSDPSMTPADVENGDVATIVKGPYIQSEEKTRFHKERTVITVEVKRTGERFRWGLNTTSNDRLVKAFGADGDMWQGLQLRVEIAQMNVSGVNKTVLYAVPMVQTRIASAAAPADPSD